MKLIVISDPDFIAQEAELISGLFREGLECMHLRKPDCRREDLANLISRIDPLFHSRISLHQHHDIANEFEIRRLHFTEKERARTSEQLLQHLKKSGHAISTSVHDLEQIRHLSRQFDYTFFGPVFNSISKAGYQGVLAKDFNLNKSYKTLDIIALGGIDTSRLTRIRAMNFDGAAVLGALWKEPEKAVGVFVGMQNIVSKKQHNR